MLVTHIGTRSEIGEALYNGMLRLRHKIFCERLHWAIPNTAQEPALYEQDEFDTPETVYVVIGNPVVACCRLIPTDKTTMISILWPDVLTEQMKTPVDWELSRFAADRDYRQPGFLSAKILHESYKFAAAKGIKSYIVISTPPAAKIIRRMGVKIEQLPSADTSIVPSRTPITNEVGELLGSLVASYAEREMAVA